MRDPKDYPYDSFGDYSKIEDTKKGVTCDVSGVFVPSRNQQAESSALKLIQVIEAELESKDETIRLLRLELGNRFVRINNLKKAMKEQLEKSDTLLATLYNALIDDDKAGAV